MYQLHFPCMHAYLKAADRCLLSWFCFLGLAKMQNLMRREPEEYFKRIALYSHVYMGLSGLLPGTLFFGRGGKLRGITGTLRGGSQKREKIIQNSEAKRPGKSNCSLHAVSHLLKYNQKNLHVNTKVTWIVFPKGFRDW